MERNMGIIDRIVRAVIGLALIAFAMGYVQPGMGWNWVGWFGVIPLLTAVVGVCPLYSLLGISTCSSQQKYG